MDTIIVNSENRKTSNPHRLLLNLSEKINLKREMINMFLYQIIVYITNEKLEKVTQKQWI